MSQSLIKATPVPAALAEVGVRVGHDEASGMAVVVIPSQVREKLNVIDPVSSFAQADPNWTPRISVVELDPDPKNGSHFYEQAGRKLAPTKQALETLAKGAGVLYTRTERVPRAELDEGEIGYRATVGIRRSDGTIEEVSRERVWVKDAERAEIEEAVSRAEEWRDGKPVRGSHKFGEPGSDSWNAEVTKRWLKELKDRSAKTESKAVLRAIRAALQIPHTFTAAEAQKPFLIIGFNFTPDYNDVETKRLLVAAGLNAQAAIYGPGATSTDEPPALPAGTDTTNTDETTTSPPPPAELSSAGADPQAASAAAASLSAADAAPGTQGDDEPDVGGSEGFNSADGPSDDDIRLAGQQAAIFSIPNGKHRDVTIGELFERDPDGARGWLRNRLGVVSEPQPYVTALWSFARVFEPELYQEALAKKEASVAS